MRRITKKLIENINTLSIDLRNVNRNIAMPKNRTEIHEVFTGLSSITGGLFWLLTMSSRRGRELPFEMASKSKRMFMPMMKV